MSFRSSLSGSMSFDDSLKTASTTTAAKEAQAKFIQERVKADGDFYGNKSANLLELQRFLEHFRAKYPNIKVQIPEVCPLSHDAIQGHLDEHAPEWRDLWNDFVRVQGQNTSLASESIEILAIIRGLVQETFDNHPLEVDDAYLQTMANKSSDLMVRSTGKEDDVLSANPGGNESVAAVKPDVASVSNAIGTVIASYFSEKSLKQRLLSPPPANDITQEPFMPVLLQRMIGEKVQTHAKSQSNQEQIDAMVYSGVMYTGEKSVTVQLAPGHGELIVNSKAPFDTFFVSREDVVYPAIYQKKYRLAPVEEEKKRKLAFVENPRSLQQTASVSSEKVTDIAILGREVEKHYGMPMDVELVYSPKEDTIYLVQARPIPVGDRLKFKPSSFPPIQALALKEDKTAEIIKAAVIAPGASAAKVITKENEILIRETIEEALTSYLAQKESKVKADVVENMAPSTSHEAAQFNAKAIPVLQVEDAEQVEEWMRAEKPVVIIDPQRSQLVNWTNKIEDYEHAEEELFAKKILEYGQFRSPLPPEVTPYAKFSADEISSAFKKFATNAKEAKIVWNNETVYSELQNQLDILEAAKAGDKNLLANQALLKIQFFMFKLAQENKNDALFQHAVVFCADIKNCLDRYSAEANANSADIRGELLDLVSKLTALITNPGKALLISDSIYQRVQHEKEAAIAKSLVAENKLTETQFAYFQELVKLRKLILNPELQAKWNQFVLECCQDKRYFLLLTRAVNMMTTYKIQSDILNVTFAASVQKNVDTKQILFALDKECAETENRLREIKLESKKMLIQSWERRTAEWGQPNTFEKLYREFQRDIIPLIGSLTIEKDTPGMTKKSILKTVQDLTEMMDKTIKALKSSPDYESDEQKKLQVVRFSKLLSHYHALMNKWMMMVDEEQYKAWETRLFDQFKLGKQGRMDAIQARFDILKESKDVAQLNSSGNFSVASARLGSSACFQQQFVEKTVTLEDMFTLMHQNIVAATNFLGKEMQVNAASLPAQIQPLVQEFARVDVYDNKADMLNIDNNYPRLQLEYNLPLANHAAKFFLNYDIEKKTALIKFNIFSMNINGRMSRISELASAEGKLLELLGVRVKQSPTYNEASACFEFAWEVKDSQIATLAPLLQKVMVQYAKNTYNRNKELSSTIFSFMNTALDMSELIRIAELLADKIKDKESQAVFAKIMSRFNVVSVTLESSNYLRIAKLFMTQFKLVSMQEASVERDVALKTALDLALSNARLAVNDQAVGAEARSFVDQLEALKNVKKDQESKQSATEMPKTNLSDLLGLLDNILKKENVWQNEAGDLFNTLPSGIDAIRRKLVAFKSSGDADTTSKDIKAIVTTARASDDVTRSLYQALSFIDSDLGKCKKDLELLSTKVTQISNESSKQSSYQVV